MVFNHEHVNNSEKNNQFLNRLNFIFRIHVICELVKILNFIKIRTTAMPIISFRCYRLRMSLNWIS